MTATATWVPAPPFRRRVISSTLLPASGTPPARTMVSPIWMPPWSAGPPGQTPLMSSPSSTSLIFTPMPA